MATTAKGITYPTATDLIKDGADPAKLATDLKVLASTTDTAIDGVKFYRGSTIITKETDLFELEAGYEYSVGNVITARDLGLPRERPGWITVQQIGTGKVLTFRSSEEGNQPSLIFTRQRTIKGVIQEWEPLVSSTDAGQADGPVRRELSQQGLTARKGGRIGTNGKGVVALRFDDAPAEFRTVVLPLLRERNLPFTRVTTSTSIHDSTIPATEFPLMQEYSVKDGGEVWAHGSDHKDAAGESAIFENLVGSLQDLRTKMPRIPIDCFAPPGGAETFYDGWLMKDLEAWANTYAGRLLMGNYALVSGYFQNSYYRPLDGQLRDGQIHYSCDAYVASSSVTQVVDRARDWKVGVSLMWHANNIGTAGKQSLAVFTECLDYIAAERDAGNIEVLTLSGMATADVTSSYRDDLLTVHSGTTLNTFVLYPQLRQSALGSTRELTATVTGTAGATVTSVIGESTKSHTIPAGGTLKLRHVATIPLDAGSNNITVSINANTTNAKLLAV